LNGFDFGRLSGIVVGTNHSAKYHRADMLVAIDVTFHEKEKAYLDGLDCLKCTYVPTPREDFIVAELTPDHANHLQDHDWHVLAANLSGYFAIAVALHLGARLVYLLGFDGGYGKDEAPNFHPYAYYGPGMNVYTPQNKFYEFFADRPVVNVGMESRIEAFKKIPINEYPSV